VSEGLDGELSPPMVNGEVVFEAPWQGRVFGMATSLADSGLYTWDEFRACLIGEVARWDRQSQGEYPYYELFLGALEKVLAQKGAVEPAQLMARLQAFRSRPHGHDH
jgi:nitrile hydratase accessory protein